ncbi:hypothetical protein N0V90_004925 [Kalmusia sp. IMI 367209]|nr:hypothetical protein N0V90_004925 [Kalmusia sp. IMI 367209]
MHSFILEFYALVFLAYVFYSIVKVTKDEAKIVVPLRDLELPLPGAKFNRLKARLNLKLYPGTKHSLQAKLHLPLVAQIQAIFNNRIRSQQSQVQVPPNVAT